MRFRILGPLEVEGDGGGRVDPAAPRQRRLLLALLVWRGEPIAADRLIDLLWSGSQRPKDPAATLRTYVTRLRSALEPERVGGQPRLLLGGPDHYILDLDGHDLDADSFERSVVRGGELVDADPLLALSHLEGALAVWRGQPLIEVADEQWAAPEVSRLEELRRTAVECRLRCLIDTGRHDQAAGELEEHVLRHPLRERPVGLLMIALDRAGRTAHASEVFRDFRERLIDETGLEPSDDLRRLHERLLRTSGTMTFTASTLAGAWNELPVTRSPIVGRDREVAQVSELLATHRIVTLTGIGGVGKTRLAVEVAGRLRDDGGTLVFVDLARITDPNDVVDAMFSALRLSAPARSARADGLLPLLRSRPVLMVADNCEHVLEGLIPLLERLTRECPELTVLATSREPLGLDGERIHRLRSLDTANAVALFRDRAAAVGPVQTFGPGDDATIVELCTRLDGIPLAIEFAAARTAHLTVEEIIEHLDERFWLLTGGRKTVPRQRTLQATIDWSYDLLEEDEQLILRAASAFVDDFDAAALAAVVGRDERSTLDLLASLARRSMVEVVGRVSPARYRLLESVRFYALDRLVEAGESSTRRRAHAEHFLRQALTVGPQLDDLPPGVWSSMCRLRLATDADADEPDLANNLAALDWFDRHGHLVDVGRLSARLASLLGYQGFLDHDRRYLARDDVINALSDPAERALYLTASALNASYLGHFAEILQLGRQAIDAAIDPGTRTAAAALTSLGSVGYEPHRVESLVQDALREIPDNAEYSRLLLQGQRSMSLVMLGRLREAADRLAAHARSGDVLAASEQMIVLHVLDEDDRAVEVPVPAGGHPDAIVLWDYRWSLVRALAAAADGDREAAARHLLESADGIASTPIALLDSDVLLGCAALAYHAGEHARCLQLLTVVGSRYRSPGSVLLASHYRDLVQDHLDAERRATIQDIAADLPIGSALRGELRRLQDESSTPTVRQPSTAS